jgi:hypothetical protein
MATRLNIAAALTAAQETKKDFDEAAGRKETAEASPKIDIRKTKTISIRLNEDEFWDLSRMALNAKMGKSDFCRINIMYNMAKIKDGALTVSGGGLIDRRA